MITLYGLTSCDRCRKARKWLDAQGIAHRFIDLRATPPTHATLAGWLDELGAEALINRRGTTWRGLSAADKARAESDPAALIAAYPALIKRPLIDLGGKRRIGFDTAVQADLAAQR